VITFDGALITISGQERTLPQIKGQVAKLLLEQAGNNHGNNRLAQRDIAIALGTGWDMIHLALNSLLHDGVIRIERNRIILNKELIQKVAGAA
jgi:DNA-binding GntR family transcriptional regulator